MSHLKILAAFVVNKQELRHLTENIHSPATTATFQCCWKYIFDNDATSGDATQLLQIDSVVDFLHDALNTGHWSQVDIKTRQSFSLANYMKCLILLKTTTVDLDTMKQCLKCIDLGILLGAPIPENPDLMTDAAKYLTCEINLNTTNQQSTDITRQNTNQLKRKLNDLTQYDCIKATEIPIEECPSVDQFNREYFQAQKPVKLTNCMTNWPALGKWWDLTYLMGIAGDRTVPIEIGSHYVDENWSQKLMTLGEFIRKHYLSDDGAVGYLAQHNLFDQISELREDIRVPEYCALSTDYENSSEPDINAWLGPKGTVSPLHQDPKNNLLAQVYGSKQLIMFSPLDSQYLYPHEGKLLSNTAQVDPLNPDPTEHVDFHKAKMYKCLLEPGEMVFIPVKWWHHVTALDKSFSVSFWWQ